MGPYIAMSNPITRRKLLQAGAAASASVLIGPAAMARTYAANEKIRFALDRHRRHGRQGRGRGLRRADHRGGRRGCQPRRRLDQEDQEPVRRREDLHRLPQALRRAEAARRRLGCHARSPSLPRHRPRPRRRAGRLLREAAVPRHLRGPQAARAGQGEEGRHADGQPGPLRRARPAAVRVDLAGNASAT